MAITSAVQRGNDVYVYTEKSGPNAAWVKPGTLQGYTSSTVTINYANNGAIHLYDENGSLIRTL